MAADLRECVSLLIRFVKSYFNFCHEHTQVGMGFTTIHVLCTFLLNLR